MGFYQLCFAQPCFIALPHSFAFLFCYVFCQLVKRGPHFDKKGIIVVILEILEDDQCLQMTAAGIRIL